MITLGAGEGSESGLLLLSQCIIAARRLDAALRIAPCCVGCASHPQALMSEQAFGRHWCCIIRITDSCFYHLLPSFARKTPNQRAALSLHLTRWRSLLTHCTPLLFCSLLLRSAEKLSRWIFRCCFRSLIFLWDAQLPVPGTYGLTGNGSFCGSTFRTFCVGLLSFIGCRE